jgi:uncharacterized protein YodC (DUF2158 family)
MTNSTIKIGDTVRLKSGGTLMCVLSIRGLDGPYYAECVWHEGKKPHSKIYHKDNLVLAAPLES